MGFRRWFGLLVAVGLDLPQCQWFLVLGNDLWLRIFIELSESFSHRLWHTRADHLDQVRCLLLHNVLDGMELVPQLALDLAHVGPAVHSVRLDVSNFLLVLFLFILVSFVVLNQVGLLWAFDDDLSYFLGSFDLIDLHLVLEPLLNDLSNRHVVDLLLCLELGGADGANTAR